jgi:hypothetical protein
MVSLRDIARNRIAVFIFILYAIAMFILLFPSSLEKKRQSPSRLSRTKSQVPFPMDPNNARNPLIFVSLASFRDPLCMTTLQELYIHADHPENLRVGIIQQNDPLMDVDCLSISNFDTREKKDVQIVLKYLHNIKILRMFHKDAKGPTWARWKNFYEHYNGEEFVLQIDSHMMFRQGWDTELMNDLRMLPPKSALSHYPHVWEVGKGPQDGHERTVPVLCSGNYDDNHILKPGGGALAVKDATPPKEQAFMAAGFAFYPAWIHDEVPLDPNLPILFHGEEVLFSFRCAVHGWRMYSPTRNNLFHFYYRKDFPKYWDDANQEWHDTHRRSIQRVKFIMGYLPRVEVENATWTLRELNIYGVNWEDPVQNENAQNYYKRWEIDPLKKKAGDFCNRPSPPLIPPSVSK